MKLESGRELWSAFMDLRYQIGAELLAVYLPFILDENFLVDRPNTQFYQDLVAQLAAHSVEPVFQSVGPNKHRYAFFRLSMHFRLIINLETWALEVQLPIRYLYETKRKILVSKGWTIADNRKLRRFDKPRPPTSIIS